MRLNLHRSKIDLVKRYILNKNYKGTRVILNQLSDENSTPNTRIRNFLNSCVELVMRLEGAVKIMSKPNNQEQSIEYLKTVRKNTLPAIRHSLEELKGKKILRLWHSSLIENAIKYLKNGKSGDAVNELNKFVVRAKIRGRVKEFKTFFRKQYVPRLNFLIDYTSNPSDKFHKTALQKTEELKHVYIRGMERILDYLISEESKTI